ncbi:hypothetical protein F4778DRAFT_779577 [Xylariomycetidae sp. FL2044]|nr:hypothetical protein F4778DRAFT_779577 [Xylariomycetidae sp. FL2044]
MAPGGIQKTSPRDLTLEQRRKRLQETIQREQQRNDDEQARAKIDKLQKALAIKDKELAALSDDKWNEMDPIDLDDNSNNKTERPRYSDSETNNNVKSPNKKKAGAEKYRKKKHVILSKDVLRRSVEDNSDTSSDKGLFVLDSDSDVDSGIKLVDPEYGPALYLRPSTRPGGKTNKE